MSFYLVMWTQKVPKLFQKYQNSYLFSSRGSQKMGQRKDMEGKNEKDNCVS